MSIAQWSTTAGNNASGVTNINWAEGQAPSTVNNSARQEMADVAVWYRTDAEWIDRNDTVTFSSGTILSFTSQNVTSIYNVGRRIRTVSATPGTLFGEITASSTSGSNTLVSIAFDSTAVLSNEAITDVSVGIVSNSTSRSSLDSGDGVLLKTQTAAVSANIPFDNTLITSRFKNYLFIWDSIIPVTGGNSLDFFMSSDNGVSYSTSYLSHTTTCESGANTYAGSGTITIHIPLALAVEGSGASGELMLFNPLSTAIQTQVLGNGVADQGANKIEGGVIRGSMGSTVTAAINNVKFQGAGATLTSGTIKMYGIK